MLCDIVSHSTPCDPTGTPPLLSCAPPTWDVVLVHQFGTPNYQQPWLNDGRRCCNPHPDVVHPTHIVTNIAAVFVWTVISTVSHLRAVSIDTTILSDFTARRFLQSFVDGPAQAPACVRARPRGRSPRAFNPHGINLHVRIWHQIRWI